MKKKILVGLLALAMPLAGCNFDLNSLKFWDKSDDTQQEKKDEGDEVKKTNLVIEEYVADIVGRTEFTEDEKSYFVSRALEFDEAKFDIAKIEEYVEESSKLGTDGVDILEIASFFKEVRDEGYLDDYIYFFTAVGKSALYAVKNNEGVETEYVQGLLTSLEKEGNDLPSNLFGLANTILDVYALATNPSFIANCADLLSSRVVSSKLKEVIKSGTEILDKFVGMKTNVVYLVNVAKDVAKDVTDLAKPKETDHFSIAMFNVIDRVLEIDLGSMVGTIFDFVSELSAKVKTIDASYYTQLDALENPAEADLYAIFGLIEHVVGDVEIKFDEASEAIESVFDFAKEIYGYLKDEIGQVPGFVNKIVDSANTKLTLVKATKLVVDVLNIRLDSINALSLAKILVPFNGNSTYSFESSGHVYSFESVDPRVKEFVTLDMINEELAKSGSFYYKSPRVQRTEEDGALISYTVDLHVSREYYDEEHYSYKYFYYVYGFRLANIDEIAPYVYAIVEEIADSDIPVTLVRDLLDLISTAYDLFDEIKDEFEIDEETLNTIELIVNFLEENNELVEKTIKDLFVVIKNLASAFVSVGGKEAEVNLTTFIFGIITEGFDPSMLQISEEKLEGLVPLLEDAYNILDKAGSLEDVLSLVASLGGVEKVETMDEFTEIIYGFIASMFVVEAE